MLGFVNKIKNFFGKMHFHSLKQTKIDTFIVL